MKIIEMYNVFPFNNYLDSLLLNKLSNFLGSLSDNYTLFRDLNEILN